MRFISPMLYISHCLRNKKTNIIHVSSDIYVLFRLGMLSILLFCNCIPRWLITVVALFFLFDILQYVSAIVFLSDVYKQPVSAKRTLMFFIINYFETILVFAIFHRQWGGLNVVNICSVQSLYFSMVTSTTLGFGDISPVNSSAQLRVVAQLVVSLLFVTIFISNASSRVDGKK